MKRPRPFIPSCGEGRPLDFELNEEQQLELAKTLNLPAVIHCRDSYEDSVIHYQSLVEYTTSLVAGSTKFRNYKYFQIKLLQVRNDNFLWY